MGRRKIGVGRKAGKGGPRRPRRNPQYFDSDADEDEKTPPSAAASSKASSGSKRRKKSSPTGGSDKKKPKIPQETVAALTNGQAAASTRQQRESEEEETAVGAYDEPSLVDGLIKRIRCYFSDEDPTEAPINEEQAKRLLEASSGNVELAAGFYWDEYFASTASNPSESKKKAAAKGASRHPSKKHEGKSSNEGEKEKDESDFRRVRRRLELDLNDDGQGRDGASDTAVKDAPSNDNGEDDDDDDGDDDNEDEDGDSDQLVNARPRRAAQARPGAAAWIPDGGNNTGESVSISDDEGFADGVWRGRQPPIARRTRRGVRQVSLQVRSFDESIDDGSSQPAKQNEEPKANKGATSGVDDGFIAKDDWVLPTSRSSQGPQLPTEMLWNLLVDPSLTGDEGQVKPSIPYTWVNAGFRMSDDGTGLIATPPTDHDVSFFRWKQQQDADNGGGASSRHVVLPPYHCRGLTAILSVVTSLIYSGASVQGKHVISSSSRKPFAELTENERKGEFEGRLVHALSVLLHIAVMKSVERKSKALAKLRFSGIEDEKRSKRQDVDRRIRLFPSCRWHSAHSGAGEATLSDDIDAGEKARIQTSYTAIDELETYVLSNIRAFTSRGGVALFLETVFRIHGGAAIHHMMKKARSEAGMLPPKSGAPLLDCTCRSKHTKNLVGIRSKPLKEDVLDTSPRSIDCMSLDLMSLLLTGEIKSSFQGWSCENLGIGILSRTAQVEHLLSHPELPIWVLHGDTCYSVVWTDLQKNPDLSLSKTDKPGDAFFLVHWNPWYGGDHKITIRVVPPRVTWKAPKRKLDLMTHFEKKQNIINKIMSSRRQEAVVTAEENKDEASSSFTQEELDKVTAHPDDVKFYPNNHQMWRFDLGTEEDEGPDYMDRKPAARGDEWRPYYRLSAKQQMKVKHKLAHKICHILWKRWPDATIDQFTPSNRPPEV